MKPFNFFNKCQSCGSSSHNGCSVKDGVVVSCSDCPEDVPFERLDIGIQAAAQKAYDDDEVPCYEEL